MDPNSKRSLDPGGEAAPAKRASATVSLVVSNEHAGAVIGPKGSTLNAIRESTGCRCTVEATPTPEQERLVQVTASTAEALSAGIASVCEALLGAPRPPQVVSFLVAPHSVGALIGKAGATINQIRQHSGADVKVDDGIRLLGTYARCDVAAGPDGAQSLRAASHLIANILFEHYSRVDGPEPVDPKQLLLSGQVGGGGGGYPHMAHAAGQALNMHAATMQSHQAQGHYPTMQPLGAPYGPPLTHGGLPLGASSALPAQVAAQVGLYGGATGGAPGPGPHAGFSGQMVALAMIIPKSLLGNVIGKAGKYFKAVRQSFGVDLRVDDKSSADLVAANGDQGALLILTGGRDQVWPAAGRCVQNMLVGLPPLSAQAPAMEGQAQASQGASQDEQPRTEMIYIEASNVSKVIGKQGSRINLIRTSAHCKVQVDQPDPAVNSGLAKCTIEGRPREILGARMLIEARESSPQSPGQPPPPDGTQAEMGPEMGSLLELFIPKKYLGNVIGKAGKYINAARASTGCNIQVLEGEGVSPATGQILATLAINGSTSQVAWVAAGHVVSHLLVGKDDEGPLAETLTVPAESVGHIIGKQGARINLIRQSSGCKVQLEQQPQSPLAVITLEGASRSVLAARVLLTARETKHGGGAGVPAPLANPLAGMPPHVPAHDPAMQMGHLPAPAFPAHPAHPAAGGAPQGGLHASPQPEQLPMGMSGIFGGY